MTNAYTEARDKAIRNLWDDYDKALSDDSDEANKYEERFKTAIDDLIRKHVIGEYIAENAVNGETTRVWFVRGMNERNAEQRKIVGGE